MQKYEDKKVVRLNFQNKNIYNGNGGGGDDMEKRIQNIENDIKVIKNDLNGNNNEIKNISNQFGNLEKLINDKFSIINDRFNNLNDRFNNMYESLANHISYRGLFGLLGFFTAVIGLFIKYIH